MQSTENHIIVQKTARYHTLGDAKQPKKIWIICHGYGQLAKFFIRKFRVLANDKTILVAPEGLSKFYLGGNNGRVGASWMTKDDRENDIKDYIAYLNTLYDHLIDQYGPEVQFGVIGFSQAAATVSRWINDGHAQVHKLILWASMFPPDIDFEVSRVIYQNLDLQWIVGDEDEYLDRMDIEKHRALLDKEDIPYQFHLFKGKHDIYESVLVERLQW